MEERRPLKEVIAEEYVKCSQDMVYFFKKYATIQHPTKGKIKFNLYRFQEECLQDFDLHRFIVINKGRQLGISTLVAGFILHRMIFYSDFNVLVIATKQEVAKNLVTKVRLMNDLLPSWLKLETIEDNKLSLKFKNGSQVKAVAATEEAGRSEALSLLVMDECAHIEENLAKKIWGASQSTLSTGGGAILLSCVTKDTLVFTDKGITEISEFVAESEIKGQQLSKYNVLGRDKLRSGFLFHNNGKVKTKKIITKFGELEGSDNHKLWAYKAGKYDWYKLSDLSEGDFVSMYYGHNTWGTNDSLSDFKSVISRKMKYTHTFNQITPDLAYLFGLYISEGSAYKMYNSKGNLVGGILTICCGDGISEVFTKLGYHYYTKDDMHYNISSKYLIELFEHVGFDLSKRAHEKEIPLRLLKMSKENIIQLLRGILDGDGFADSSRARVGLTSSSAKLIEQVRVVLSNFGILATKQTKTVEQLNKGNHFEYPFKHPSYILEVTGEMACRYSDSISFNVERKRKICEKYTFLDRNIQDVVPNSIQLYKDIKKISGLKNYQISKLVGYKVNSYLNATTEYKTDLICRKNVIQAYAAFEHLLYETEWSKIVDPNLMWVPIKKIKNKENYTYDFSLPDDGLDFWSHSVVYNGFLGHQSPNGQGNLFHQKWVAAGEGKEFYPIELPWYVHPDRDQAWRDQQTVLLGEKMAAQENDCDFLTSGNSVIDGTILDWYKETHVRDPIEKRGFDMNYWLWENPDYTKSYVVTVDVARGDGEDGSAILVMEIESMRQVAEWYGMIGTTELGNMAVAIATEWNDALLAIENVGVGWAVIQVALDRNYINLFYYYKDDPYLDDKHLLHGYDLQDKSKMTPGIPTNTKTRPVMISKLEVSFRLKLVICRSSRSIGQLAVFIWKKGRPEAMDGFHDDLSMAWAMALWLRDTAIRLRQDGVELSKAMIDGFSRTIYMPSKDDHSVYHQPIGHGQYDDLKWLIR